MLAAVGALAPELMSRTGAIPPKTGLPWFVAGGLFSDSREGGRKGRGGLEKASPGWGVWRGVCRGNGGFSVP
jgi:hypothetical protein